MWRDLAGCVTQDVEALNADVLDMPCTSTCRGLLIEYQVSRASLHYLCLAAPRSDPVVVVQMEYEFTSHRDAEMGWNDMCTSPWTTPDKCQTCYKQAACDGESLGIPLCYGI